jgi:hypothetical protein
MLAYTDGRFYPQQPKRKPQMTLLESLVLRASATAACLWGASECYTTGIYETRPGAPEFLFAIAAFLASVAAWAVIVAIRDYKNGTFCD